MRAGCEDVIIVENENLGQTSEQGCSQVPTLVYGLECRNGRQDHDEARIRPSSPDLFPLIASGHDTAPDASHSQVILAATSEGRSLKGDPEGLEWKPSARY